MIGAPSATLLALAKAHPAPRLGTTTPVLRWGRYLGSVTHLAGTPHHVPVCAHRFCQRRFTARLEPRPTHATAAGRLLLHWDVIHGHRL